MVNIGIIYATSVLSGSLHAQKSELFYPCSNITYKIFSTKINFY